MTIFIVIVATIAIITPVGLYFAFKSWRSPRIQIILLASVAVFSIETVLTLQRFEAPTKLLHEYYLYDFWQIVDFSVYSILLLVISIGGLRNLSQSPANPSTSVIE